MSPDWGLNLASALDRQGDSFVAVRFTDTVLRKYFTSQIDGASGPLIRFPSNPGSDIDPLDQVLDVGTWNILGPLGDQTAHDGDHFAGEREVVLLVIVAIDRQRTVPADAAPLRAVSTWQICCSVRESADRAS